MTFGATIMRARATKVRRGWLFPLLGLMGVCVTPPISRATADSTMKCIFTLGKEQLFVGDRKCLRRLRPQVVSGYWVVDHEYSVFYKRLPSPIPAFDSAATWLEFESKLGSSELGTHGPGRRIYRIRFLGMMSKQKGIYGNGTFRSGALVMHLIETRPIK